MNKPFTDNIMLGDVYVSRGNEHPVNPYDPHQTCSLQAKHESDRDDRITVVVVGYDFDKYLIYYRLIKYYGDTRPTIVDKVNAPDSLILGQFVNEYILKRGSKLAHTKKSLDSLTPADLTITPLGWRKD